MIFQIKRTSGGPLSWDHFVTGDNEPEVQYVSINTLEDLLEIVRVEKCHIIVNEKTLEVYDDYRE